MTDGPRPSITVTTGGGLGTCHIQDNNPERERERQGDRDGNETTSRHKQTQNSRAHPRPRVYVTQENQHRIQGGRQGGDVKTGMRFALAMVVGGRLGKGSGKCA